MAPETQRSDDGLTDARRPDGRQHLADRYPRRQGRPVVIVVVAAIAAVGLGWLGWTAWVHSRPAVSGAVQAWEVTSDTEVRFTLAVDRPDPSVRATCRVIAQAPNFEIVGEKNVAVGATDARVVDVRQTMRTLRRATSVSLDRCWTS